MAISIVNSGTAEGAGFDININTTGVTNPFLVATIVGFSDVISIKYNDVDFTHSQREIKLSNSFHIYGIVPDIGNHNLTISFTYGLQHLIVWTLFSGVSPVIPVGTMASPTYETGGLPITIDAQFPSSVILEGEFVNSEGGGVSSFVQDSGQTEVDNIKGSYAAVAVATINSNGSDELSFTTSPGGDSLNYLNMGWEIVDASSVGDGNGMLFLL